MLNILNLVIYSDNEKQKYNEMYLILKELYDKYENHSILKLKTFFLKFVKDLKEPYICDGILHLNGIESFIPGILEKSIKGFEFFEKELDKYDYVIRSNISTIIDFPLLVQDLEKTPIRFYGGGYKRTLNWRGGGIVDNTWYGTEFILGTSIIFTSYAIKCLLEKKDLIRFDIIDDVSFAVFVREHYPNEKVQCINMSKYYQAQKLLIDQNALQKTVLSNKYIFYRNKSITNNRSIDVAKMRIIKNNILDKEKL